MIRTIDASDKLSLYRHVFQFRTLQSRDIEMVSPLADSMSWWYERTLCNIITSNEAKSSEGTVSGMVNESNTILAWPTQQTSLHNIQICSILTCESLYLLLPQMARKQWLCSVGLAWQMSLDPRILLQHHVFVKRGWLREHKTPTWASWDT